MAAPLVSTITLCTEILVSACVYFLIWRAYSRGQFIRWLAFCVLGYEALFNITYMFSRLGAHVEKTATSAPSHIEIALAIFHGIFSIIMFVLLIAFFAWAERAYARGQNFFREHRTLTLTFALAWGISVLTGIIFYFVLYVF